MLTPCLKSKRQQIECCEMSALVVGALERTHDSDSGYRKTDSDCGKIGITSSVRSRPELPEVVRSWNRPESNLFGVSPESETAADVVFLFRFARATLKQIFLSKNSVLSRPEPTGVGVGDEMPDHKKNIAPTVTGRL